MPIKNKIFIFRYLKNAYREKSVYKMKIEEGIKVSGKINHSVHCLIMTFVFC